MMDSNVVSNNASGNYIGVTSTNDVQTTATPSVLPSIRINEYDELVDYYIDGYSSYVNCYPVQIQAYNIDTDQSIGTDHPLVSMGGVSVILERMGQAYSYVSCGWKG